VANPKTQVLGFVRPFLSDIEKHDGEFASTRADSADDRGKKTRVVWRYGDV
jgi:hypothetical protein